MRKQAYESSNQFEKLIAVYLILYSNGVQFNAMITTYVGAFAPIFVRG